MSDFNNKTPRLCIVQTVGRETREARPEPLPKLTHIIPQAVSDMAEIHSLAKARAERVAATRAKVVAFNQGNKGVDAEVIDFPMQAYGDGVFDGDGDFAA